MYGTGASIDAQARRWLLLMDPGPATPEQRAAFEEWLLANPQHRTAYEDARRVWDGIGQLSHLGAYLRKEDLERFKREAPAAPVEPGIVGSKRAFEWRPQAVAVLALIVVAVFGVVSLFGPGEEFTTSVGEIDRVSLPDGSEVVLGAKSDITVAFTSKERRIELLAGEAFFTVAADVNRPFLVAVDDQIVRAVGTQFEVHRSGQRIRVAVVEGLVEVLGPPPQPATGDAPRLPVQKTVLGAGQQFVASRGAAAVAVPVRAISTEQAASWRIGRLFYEDATLAEVVDDVSRYYPHRIEIASEEVRALRITGSFQLDRIDKLFENLERALPIRVERRADASIMLTLEKE